MQMASDVSTLNATKESMGEEPSRRLALFALVGLTAVFVISVLLKPATGEYFTICGFKNFTGLPCPGCGLTHSFCAVAHGSFVEAFKFNLLGPPLYVVLAFVWIRSAGVLINCETFVRTFDRIVDRLNLIRVIVYSFAIYGSVRIVYLLAFQPVDLHDSPLSKLIARLIH
jgi:hypothetical protein